MLKQNRFQQLILFFIIIFRLYSQENDVKVNLNWAHQRHQWEADWISHPTASLLEYGVFHFRKTFCINRPPDSCRAYVSADNRYRLFVNGKQVSHGPARGSLDYWRYETVDIASHLQAGKNVIAVEVFNLGRYKPAAQFSRQTAFILQADEPIGHLVNTGKTQWKVMENKGYQAIPVTRERVRGYYVAGPTDRIDGSLYPWGWQTPEYDDSFWHDAMFVEVGAGRGFMHGVLWLLVPRNIPMMEETPKRFQVIRRSKNIRIDPGWLRGETHLEIAPYSKVSLLLDMGHLTVGYPEMRLSGGKGSRIQLSYAESLYLPDGRKGNRNTVENKEMLGYFDVYQPEGGAHRLYRPLWLRTWRYAQVDIETDSQGLKIHDYHGIQTVYPFCRLAKFESGLPLHEEIWDIGWRTARLCAGETYFDCPYYEQLQYIGDTRIQALISLYQTGDDRLMRNALLQADHSRISEGLTLSRGPSSVTQIIPSFSLFWVAMIHDYYMHQSDDAFIESFLPGIESVLGWFERRLSDNGLVGPLDWLNFSDWTPGFHCGSPAGADTGHSALISLNYVYALTRAADLFEHFGDSEHASRYRRQADRIRKAVRTHCFDETKKQFADTPEKKVFSQHTQIFAILTGTVAKEEQAPLMRTVLQDSSLIQTTIYYKFYLFKALVLSGLGNQYLEQMEVWQDMLNLGLTTFREGDYEDRSDCHAWSASPLYDFLAIVCGIMPAEPGFKSVRIQPHLGALKQVKASMPHPAGMIHVEFIQKGGTREARIQLPQGVSGKLIWNGKTVSLTGGGKQILRVH